MVVVSSLTENTRQLFSLRSSSSVSQMCESSVGYTVLHSRVFSSVSGELSDHKPFLKAIVGVETASGFDTIQGFRVSIRHVCKIFFYCFNLIDCN